MTSPRRASFEDVDVLISDGDDAPPATILDVPTVPLKRMEGKLYRRSQKLLYVGRTFVLDAGTLSYTSTAKEESVDIAMTNVRTVKKLIPSSYEIGLLMWNDQVFRLRTETKAEFEEWTEQLEAHMNQAQNTRGRSLTMKQEGAALKDVRDRHHVETDHTNASPRPSSLRSRASALLSRSSGKLSSSSKSVKEESAAVPSAGAANPPAAANRFIERARTEMASTKEMVRKRSGSGSKETLSLSKSISMLRPAKSKDSLSPRKSEEMLGSPRESPRQRLGSVTAADV